MDSLKVKFSPVEKNDAFKVLKADTLSGQVMKPHKANRDSFFTVLSGAVDFTLGDDSIPMESGDHLVIPSGVVHSFEVVADGGCMLVLDAQATISFV